MTNILHQRIFGANPIVPVGSMDHANLEIFRVLARELSVTQTAARMGRVPSNVTTRIQQLEEDLGVSLFERDKKRFSLTPEGERFLDYTERLLNLADEARQAVKPNPEAGTLRIGTMEAAAASRLPAPLAIFHRQWPGVRLEVSTGPSQQLLDGLKKRRIDCAFIAMTSSVAQPGDDIETLPLLEEDLVLLMPATPSEKSKPSSWSLATFQAGCTYRAVAEDWLATHGVSKHGLRLQEVGSYHAMVACVSAGSSVCVVPQSVLNLMPQQTGLTAQTIATVPTLLAWRRGYDTPAFAAWRTVLTDTVPPKGAA